MLIYLDQINCSTRNRIVAVQTHRDFCILGLRLLGLNQRITTGSYHCVFGMRRQHAAKRRAN